MNLNEIPKMYDKYLAGLSEGQKIHNEYLDIIEKANFHKKTNQFYKPKPGDSINLIKPISPLYPKHFHKPDSDISHKPNCGCLSCKDISAAIKIMEMAQNNPIPNQYQFISVKENTPTTPITPPKEKAISFTSQDIKTIAKSLVEAMNDPNTKAQLTDMSQTDMTAWIAKKIGKPVITTEQSGGKVIFKESEVLVATPEEIAAFERDFMM